MADYLVFLKQLRNRKLNLRRHVEFFVCSARAPAQHCWMCCANERNIVGPRFDDRETIEMLALVGSKV